MSEYTECPIPPMLSNQPDEPPNKKPKESTEADQETGQKMLNIAVAGCSHGEMDLIYSTLAVMEKNRNVKFDLLICCGDYQSVRNTSDLNTMHVNRKYRQLGTFHHYYSGQKVAPIFTIFVGGNHEASGFLAELPHGGWVAPNIYYMGYASVVQFGGLRIGGLSGIYKSQDYVKSHFESPPYFDGSTISAYHVRNVDVFRLKQMAMREEGAEEDRVNGLDIMISHDWPCGITDFGDTEKLLRYKQHFKEDIQKRRLGNPFTMELLKTVKPKHWFAAHLHCRYEAKFKHEQVDTAKPADTNFLALDKPIRGRKFLEAIQIPLPGNVAEITFEYDPIWLAVLRNTDHLTQISRSDVYMPSKASAGTERFDFRPTTEEIAAVKARFKDLNIPNNFRQTGKPFTPGEGQNEQWYYKNPQTTEFCEKLGINNLNEMLYKMHNKCRGVPYCDFANAVNNADEIDLGDDDDDDAVDGDFVLDDGTSAATIEGAPQP